MTENLLAEAIERGDMNTAQLLLAAGLAKPTDEYRDVPVVWLAIQARQFEIAELLLSLGANLEHRLDGYLPAWVNGIAAYKHREDISPALTLLADPVALRFTLDRGVPLTANDVHALHEEAVNVTILKIIRHAIKQGVNMNANCGREGIMLSGDCSLSFVNLMLHLGYEVNLPSYSGRTALSYASTPEVARALLRAGANLNAVSDDGRTALGFAIASGRTNVIHALLTAGATLAPKEEADALASATNLEPNIFNRLLERSNPNAVSPIGHCVLTAAIQLHQEGVPKNTWFRTNFMALIQAGANVNVGDVRNVTPLIQASMCASRNKPNHHMFEIVRMLVEAGANPRITTAYNYSSITYAEYHKNQHLIQLLENAAVQMEAEGYA